MWLSVFVSGILLSTISFSWAQETNPSFSVSDPLGRLVYYNLKNTKHYLGYFCLEREIPGDPLSACVLAQYGIGEDLPLGVDAMGNPTNEMPGTWIGIGPVFTKTKADEFYHRSMTGASQSEFQEVWKKIWTREGWNYSQIPVEVSVQTMRTFFNLLENSPPIEIVLGSKIKTKKLVGRWSLGKWDGEVEVSRYKKLMICIDFWGRFRRHHCYVLREGSLSKGAALNTFEAFDEHGLPIHFSFSQKGALLLTIQMTVPANTPFTNPDDGNDYETTAPQKVIIQCSKK